MNNFLKTFAVFVFTSSVCMAATITINGQTVGPGTPKMTVDGVAVGQTTTGSTTRSTTYYSDGSSSTTVYRNGYITRVYQNGVLRAVYQDGTVVDWNQLGGLINVRKDVVFDLRNESHPLHAGKFSEYFNAFLNNYKINDSGRFTPATNARTPANQYTRNEFKHFVAEGRPTLVIESIDRCVRCSGSGHHPSLVNNILTEIQCVSCNGRGHIANTQNVSLTNTGNLPERPTIKDFISIGLISENRSEPTPNQENTGKEKKAGMLLDLKKIVPSVEPPKPAPAPEPVAEKKAEPEIQLTPLQRFQMTKGKAEAGNSQAQYELALLYLQESEKPVPLDYFEAFSWMLKASMKNHKMAQFHLGRLYENGFGTDKSLENAIKWRRSAALLGCKQSQKWMGQLYVDIFNGNPKFADLIKPDPSNLIEAYAWYNLGGEIPFANRADPKTPGPDELTNGDHPLNVRDYNFEKSIPVSSARDRDAIARLPSFNRKMYDDAKARCNSLAKEAEEHRAQNRPK